LGADTTFTIGSGYNSSKSFALTAQLGTQIATIYSYQTIAALAGFALSSNFSKETSPPTGTTSSFQLILTPYGGYTTSSIQLACQGLPAGATCLFGSTALALPVAGFVGDGLIVQVGSSVPIGTYPFVVTATDGSVTQQLKLTLNVADFSVSLTPAAVTIQTGNSTNLSLLIQAIGNWTDVVNVSCQ
jgi:hypothetical protein